MTTGTTFPRPTETDASAPVRGGTPSTGAPTLRGDATAAFLAEGYGFGRRRFESLGTDAFRTRLLGKRVTFLRGTDAARFFYERDRFSREGALPPTVVHSLQDEGSVQTLTGAAHRHRKSLFTQVLDDASAAELTAAFDRAWTDAAGAWAGADPVPVIPATGRVLTRAALEWAGIREPEAGVDQRAREFLAMIDGAGSFGIRNVSGLALRRRTERWATGVVRELRPLGDAVTPAARVALWRDERGELLDEDVAVVELLNILRPVVAVSRFIAFAALALHQHPEWRERVVSDDAALAAFTEEIRRTAPFFPAIAGRANGAHTWHDVEFAEGDWVVLDMFATNRHPGLWGDAEQFRPERFLTAAPEVVAQGAGEPGRGHRCPGEPATVDLLAEATKRLAGMSWSLPPQDLRVDLRRFPAAPGGGGIRLRFEAGDGDGTGR